MQWSTMERLCTKYNIETRQINLAEISFRKTLHWLFRIDLYFNATSKKSNQILYQ